MKQIKTNDKKVQIYLNTNLYDIREKCKEDGSKTFSQAIRDLADRYTLIMKNTELPELTEKEKFILKSSLFGTVVNDALIKNLELQAYYMAGEFEDDKDMHDLCLSLGAKLEKTNITQKIKIMDELGV